MKKKIALKTEDIEFRLGRNKAQFLVFRIREKEELYAFRDKSERLFSEFIYEWLYPKFLPAIEEFIHENKIEVCGGSFNESRGDITNIGIFLNINPDIIEIRNLTLREDDSFIPTSIIEIECDLEKEYEDFVKKKNEELIKLYRENVLN